MPTSSVLPDNIASTAIAADGILCLTDVVTFSGLTAGSYTFRSVFDCGQVDVAAGTAGKASVAVGLWVQTAATAAPTVFSTHDYRHRITTVTRHATLDQSFPLGAMVIDQTITLTADDWEVYVGIGIEAVGDLNGVNVTGIGPSGFVTIGTYTGGEWSL